MNQLLDFAQEHVAAYAELFCSGFLFGHCALPFSLESRCGQPHQFPASKKHTSGARIVFNARVCPGEATCLIAKQDRSGSP
jgi:hypothetical protein